MLSRYQQRDQSVGAVGIRFDEMTSGQQSTLRKLIDEYLSTLPDELARQRMENIESEEMDEVRFGWAGSMQAREGHYYRIQGEDFPD